MAGFWAWFASPHVGRGFDVALELASVAAIAVFGRRGDLRAVGLSVPLLLALAIGLAFTGLALIQGDGMEQHAVSIVSGRYWRTRDNAIPLLLAARMAVHGRLSGLLVGSWLCMDAGRGDLGQPGRWRIQGAEPGWMSGFLGYARMAQIDDLLPAAGLLLFGAAALLARPSSRALAPIVPLGAVHDVIRRGPGRVPWHAAAARH